MSEYRVLVCGGRNYADRDRAFRVLDEVDGAQHITEIIEGGAMGADHMARLWAHLRNRSLTTFAADWDMHGKAAGPIRNEQMLLRGMPALVVAFPGGRGTADMVRQAKSVGVRVLELTASRAPNGAA